jgi:hypothetical protein
VPNRSKALAAALLVAVFVAGAAVGWGVTRWRAHPEGGRRRSSEEIVQFLDRKLDLRPGQRDSVHSVFVHYRPVMDSIWSAVHPRMDSLRSAMRAEISALLDSTQRDRYAQLIARRRHHHRRGEGATDTSGRRQ